MLKKVQLLYLKKLRIILKKYIRSARIKNLYCQIDTNKEYAYLLMLFLKFHFTSKFCVLTDIAVIDVPSKKKRFSLVYNLLSVHYNTRLFVKCQITDISKILSVSSLFSAANWYEREVWDMFGIFFFKHPDLRRLLNDYNFQGYPLKKDFPLTGFLEVVYNTTEMRVIYKKVKLDQEYRNFIYVKGHSIQKPSYNAAQISTTASLLLYTNPNIGGGLNPWNYVPQGHIPCPDDVRYICGMLIGLLVIVLINYEYFSVYIRCSNIFIYSNYYDMKKLIKKFSLKEKPDSFIQFFWPFTVIFISVEGFIALFLRLYCKFSYLEISIFTLTIPFLMSVFSLSVIANYLAINNDLIMALRLRDARLRKLESDLVVERDKLRAFALKEFKTEYNEDYVTRELEKIRELRTLSINEAVFDKESAFLESLKEDELFMGTIPEWLEQPTHLQLFMALFYPYYIIVCCFDSPFLYERIWPFLFGLPPEWQYTFTTRIIDRNALLTRISLEEYFPMWEILRDTCCN